METTYGFEDLSWQKSVLCTLNCVSGTILKPCWCKYLRYMYSVPRYLNTLCTGP